MAAGGRSRGARVAAAGAILCIATLAFAGYAFRRQVLERWHLFRLGSGDPAVVDRSARALGEMRSIRAIPALIGRLGGSGRADDGIRAALVRIGPPSVPGLVKALRDTPAVSVQRSTSRKDAAFLEGSIRDIFSAMGRSSVPPLVAALRDPEMDTRIAALVALLALGGEAREAVPALVEALRDPEWRVRGHAIWVLGKIGPDARAAIPELERLRKDDQVLAASASEALGKIRGETRDFK